MTGLPVEILLPLARNPLRSVTELVLAGMKKIFPYLRPGTARQLRTQAAQRSVKIRGIIEAAIAHYADALALTADQLQDVELRRRNRLALERAQQNVRDRVKTDSVKIGASISPHHYKLLTTISGTDRFLSDTLECVLTFHLWHDPVVREERDNLTGFLWPPIDLPVPFEIRRFLANVSGVF